ncbi:MAG: M48 family metalloprotease [Acidimicrobiales bacterium]
MSDDDPAQIALTRGERLAKLVSATRDFAARLGIAAPSLGVWGASGVNAKAQVYRNSVLFTGDLLDAAPDNVLPADLSHETVHIARKNAGLVWAVRVSLALLVADAAFLLAVVGTYVFLLVRFLSLVVSGRGGATPPPLLSDGPLLAGVVGVALLFVILGMKRRDEMACDLLAATLVPVEWHIERCDWYEAREVQPRFRLAKMCSTHPSWSDRRSAIEAASEKTGRKVDTGGQ